MSPKILWVFAAVYVAAAVGLGLVSAYNFKRGVTGIAAASAAGAAYSLFRAGMVVRKARGRG